MNIETVNELIQSLESAGELSIKERKYLELAKAYQQLAAENVALKAGVTYFAYSPEYGFDYFKDKQSAEHLRSSRRLRPHGMRQFQPALCHGVS